MLVCGDMNFLEILLIALGMAMDAFAVCLGAGTQARALRSKIDLSAGVPFWVVPILHAGNRLVCRDDHFAIYFRI